MYRTKARERANEHQAVISLGGEQNRDAFMCVCVCIHSKAKEIVNHFSERSACESSSANQEASQTVRAAALASVFKENRKL
jgi:hypothetical protein